MNQKEKKLFLELCRYRDIRPGTLRRLIRRGAATPAVLGHLCWNRMAAIAYGVLKESDLLAETNREFRNTLESIYLRNREKNESYFACLRLLSRALKRCRGKYALLKGAYLCKAYPAAFRTSTDIDILTAPENLAEISDCLHSAGFRQGSIRNGVFHPASREEVIRSRCLRGETVPFIREVNLPAMRYLEVDLNFSLSYKNERRDAVQTLISRARQINVGALRILTLERSDFILHLCAHLYKEAATYPWIRMKRDMTLYKFCDLYTLLQDLDEKDFETLAQRARELGLESVCYYALHCTRTVFSLKNKSLDAFLRRIPPQHPEILDIVVSPEEKKYYRYREHDLRRRFFSADRTALLEEVSPDDGTFPL